jgi:hypothetical protein
VAPDAARPVTTRSRNRELELLTRRAGRFLWVIAVRRGGATSIVELVGLPRKRDGKPITSGRVLFEHTQQPPPPPIVAGRQNHRVVRVAEGGFRDWFAPHDVHVYRFAL